MLRGKRICLLIAHPDDEAMFFAPTVIALTRPELQNHVKILCLSSGDAAGLGETRKRELTKSGLVLGLRKAEDVFVVDNPAYVPLFCFSPANPPPQHTHTQTRTYKPAADTYCFNEATFPTP